MKQKTYGKDILMIIAGSFLFAASVNLFIVPLNLYNGGCIGIAQILRTLITQHLHINFSFDIAGILNMALNIPLFILAYRSLSKKFLFGTLISLVVQTIGFSLIPIPAVPILNDVLASCIIGAIVGGIGVGMTLITGASGGGTDILGVYAALKWERFSVGKVQLIINGAIYLACAVMFELPTAIYSIIYAAIYSFVLDKAHLQNIEMSAMIFTKNPQVRTMILKDFVRGVTYWKGMGAYTESDTEVLVTILSKYEVDRLKKCIVELDPHAFIIINEGLKVTGGYEKRLIV